MVEWDPLPSLGWSCCSLVWNRLSLLSYFPQPHFAIPTIFGNLYFGNLFSHGADLEGWVLTKAQLGLWRSGLSPKDPKEGWSWAICHWKWQKLSDVWPDCKISVAGDLSSGRTVGPWSLLTLSPSSHEMSSEDLPCAPWRDGWPHHKANRSWQDLPKP